MPRPYDPTATMAIFPIVLPFLMPSSFVVSGQPASIHIGIHWKSELQCLLPHFVMGSEAYGVLIEHGELDECGFGVKDGWD